MQRSLEKILKILNLEIQGKYNNKAIIGGLDKFLPSWTLEAKTEQVPEEVFEKIHNLFLNYSQMSLQERETVTRSVLELLKTSNANSLTTGKINENVSSQKSNPKPATVAVTHGSPLQPKEMQHQGAHLGMDAPVTVLHGIGSAKQDLFHSIGVNKLSDLFYYFPRRYDDFSQLKPINRIEFGEELTIIATVQSFMTTRLRGRDQARVEVVVSDGTGFLRLVFFRSMKYIQSFENHFHRGTQLVISGKVSMYLGRKQIDNPNFEPLDKAHLNTNGIIPVYPLTSGLTQKDIRSAVNSAINYYSTKIQDYIPTSIKQSANLVDLPVALHQIHYPDSLELLKVARDRLAFDEIFLLQLGVQQQKRAWHASTAHRYQLPIEEMQKITSTLTFSLTKAQQKVIEEILSDLDSGFPMNRLIQGDVGSGKTIVAAIASVSVNHQGGQTAVMAPTGILAEQHLQTFLKLLSKENSPELPLESGQIRLLTSDTSSEEREAINQGLQDGSILILIGTHALIEDPIKFKNLQLAVIDEQHRFGIAQRSALRQKGENPHLLVMSATPIPRSLALTVFGDLDISIIDEMPTGRKPVETQIIHPFAREKAYQLIQNEISHGQQAFIVYPLIEQGENEDQKAAVDEHSHLQKEVFPKLRLGLLHGKMPPDEKDLVMKKFRDKEFDILVSTTVIEVGVDIPNASVMLIESANRFGLAQLHQLRGRVGRGGNQAYCLLIPENEDGLENERLAAMIETTDGFVLAEKDLSQRGPGDFIGYRQSGFADLRMATLADIKLIEKARHYAEELFKEDPLLEKQEHRLISQRLQQAWNPDSSDIS